MKNTETSRISQKGLKIIRALGMFGVALLFCVITTASSSWLSSERVFAVGGIPYIVNEVTKKDIEDAKKKRTRPRPLQTRSHSLRTRETIFRANSQSSIRLVKSSVHSMRSSTASSRLHWKKRRRYWMNSSRLRKTLSISSSSSPTE